MKKIVSLFSQLLAPMSVVSVVVAAGLTELGHPWLGVTLLAVLCVFSMVIERPMSAKRFDSFLH